MGKMGFGAYREIRAVESRKARLASGHPSNGRALGTKESLKP